MSRTREISENEANIFLNNIIPGNSKNENIVVQKIINPDIFLNMSTNGKDSEQGLKNNENSILIESSTIVNDETEPTN